MLPVYVGSVNRLHFCIIVLRLFNIFGAVGLFRSDMLLIFNMVWPWFSCGTVCVCPQFPYHDNDIICWIFPIVPCHSFCIWHWPMGKDLDLSFIWGRHHLHLVGIWMISRPADYFFPFYTVLTRPNSCRRLQFLAFSLDSIRSLPR